MNVEDEDDDVVVTGALLGFVRWDARATAAIARVLRSGAVSALQLKLLARLIEGTHREGLELRMHGQGNGLTIFESAQMYDRCISIGHLVLSALEKGETLEAAKIDAAEKLGISEVTVERSFRVFLQVRGAGEADAS